MSTASPAQDTDTSNSRLNPAQLASLHRHVVYGQASRLATERVTVEHQDVEPFSKPKSTVWSVPLQFDHIRRILMGFEPCNMDERWLVYSTGPDASEDAQGGEFGRATVNMHRSWTGYLNLAVDLIVDDPMAMMKALEGTSEAAVSDAAGGTEIAGRITGLTWETDEDRVCFGRDDPADWVRNLCPGLFGFVMPADAPLVPMEKQTTKKK